MKTLITCIFLLSTSVFAEGYCDLNEGINFDSQKEKVEYKVEQDGNVDRYYSSNEVLKSAMQEAYRKCQKDKAEGCAVVNGTTRCFIAKDGFFTNSETDYTCTATAWGYKVLSAKEAEKRIRALTCQNIAKCRNASVNDRSADKNFYDRLDAIAKHNKCD